MTTFPWAGFNLINYLFIYLFNTKLKNRGNMWYEELIFSGIIYDNSKYGLTFN